jgi:predicted transcriptional regulator
MKKIDIYELHFIKMLLMKFDYINNKPVTIRDIYNATGIHKDDFIKPLRQLMQKQIVSLSNIKFDTDTPTLTTIEEYLTSIEPINSKGPDEQVCFNININKDELIKYLDNYLAGFQNDESKDDEKLSFTTQEKMIYALIAEITNDKINKLKKNEKESPFGIEIIIDGEGFADNRFNLLETLLIIEKDNLIKVSNIGPVNTILDWSPLLGGKSISTFSKIEVLVNDYKHNKILLANNNNQLKSTITDNHNINMREITKNNKIDLLRCLLKLRLNPNIVLDHGYDILLKTNEESIKKELRSFANDEERFYQVRKTLNMIKKDNELLGADQPKIEFNFTENDEDSSFLISNLTTEKIVLHSIIRLINNKENFINELSKQEYQEILPYLRKHEKYYNQTIDKRYIKNKQVTKVCPIEPPLTDGIDWENITLKFIVDDSTNQVNTVDIYTNNEFHCHSKMKLIGLRKGLWEKLYNLGYPPTATNPASCLPYKIFSTTNDLAFIGLTEKLKNDRLKKIRNTEEINRTNKREISACMRYYFGIESDPFSIQTNEIGMNYIPKFKIETNTIDLYMPEPTTSIQARSLDETFGDANDEY